MASEILLVINLPGQIGGCVKSEDKQSSTVDVTPLDPKHSVFFTREITHTDRKNTVCYRTLRINEETVASWQSNECPHWAKDSIWKKISKKQRMEAFIKRFDEGYGINYSLIN